MELTIQQRCVVRALTFVAEARWFIAKQMLILIKTCIVEKTNKCPIKAKVLKQKYLTEISEVNKDIIRNASIEWIVKKWL